MLTARLIFSLVLHLLLIESSRPQHLVPCSVDWVEHDYGDDLPGSLVASHPGKYWVAKVMVSGSEHVAYIDKDGMAYSQFGRFTSCSLLVNPNNCHIKWAKSKTKIADEYFVKVGSEEIVRVSWGNDWITGYRIGFSFIWLVSGYGHIKLPNYQILTSESSGFHLEIVNFKFTSSPFDNRNIGFMGLDSIYNKSPSEVTQIVTHTKTVSESVSTTESQSFSHTASVGASAGFSFFGIGASVKLDYSFTSTNSKSRTVTQEKSTTVSVSRQITVPPLTSVEACSTLSMVENFVLQWTAEGIFTLEGMSGEDIEKMFENPEFKIPYTVKRVTETAVVADISGRFTGSLALQTKFIAVPDDSTLGCADLQDAIETYERAKQDNSTMDQLKSLRNNIDHIMTQITDAGIL